jgi:hypothetical protein
MQRCQEQGEHTSRKSLYRVQRNGWRVLPKSRKLPGKAGLPALLSFGKEENIHWRTIEKLG